MFGRRFLNSLYQVKWTYSELTEMLTEVVMRTCTSTYDESDETLNYANSMARCQYEDDETLNLFVLNTPTLLGMGKKLLNKAKSAFIALPDE